MSHYFSALLCDGIKQWTKIKGTYYTIGLRFKSINFNINKNQRANSYEIKLQAHCAAQIITVAGNNDKVLA